MEQAVWLYFGIIAVIVGFGAIITIVSWNTESSYFQSFRDSIDKMGVQCNILCSLSPGNNLPIDCSLPSGMVLYTSGNKICGLYKGESKCSICNCEIRKYRLDLNTTLAKEAFDIHTYKCFFERTQNDTILECKG
jgi:hypothetical protein